MDRCAIITLKVKQITVKSHENNDKWKTEYRSKCRTLSSGVLYKQLKGWNYRGFPIYIWSMKRRYLVLIFLNCCILPFLFIIRQQILR